MILSKRNGMKFNSSNCDVVQFFCIHGCYHWEMPKEEKVLGILPERIMNPVF